MAEERYGFLVEWFDTTASLNREFQLFYYPVDSSVEMYDAKNRRLFLKRIAYPEIQLKDLYVGATAMVYYRQLKVTDYADEMTKLRLSNKDERTIILVAPNGMPYLGSILNHCYRSLKLTITKLKMVELTDSKAAELHEKLSGVQEALLGLDRLTCDRAVVIEVKGENAIRKWRDFLGLTLSGDTGDCQAIPPSFGGVNIASCCYGSPCRSDVERDYRLLFDPNLRPSAVYQGTTCCVIKPHIIQNGDAGRVMAAILDAGFHVTAMGMFQLDMTQSEEFYEVYQSVLSEYKDMVNHLASGQCIAMEIASNCENTHKAFRDFVGPADPEVARILRPTTLRSMFGKSRILNAVHCTDLEDDTLLEVEFFFKLLNQNY